jgi:prepilin-type N-terminal cleavage/methylation domain-containing protein
MRRQAGFTLVEVLIAMLIGTVGLLGTIAVQQAIVNASRNANDAAVAMRLASQKTEELISRIADTKNSDMNYGLGSIAPPIGSTPVWHPLVDGVSMPEYVDAQGEPLRDNTGKLIVPTETNGGLAYRWRRQWRITNTGVSLPYVISVIVTYDNDMGDARTTRLDVERRKSW